MSRLQIVLLVLVVMSAVMVIGVRHQNRLEFVKLQSTNQHLDTLQSEWGRLMLEKATWTRQHNVADTAQSSLAMSAPEPDQIVTLRLAPQVKEGGRENDK